MIFFVEIGRPDPRWQSGSLITRHCAGGRAAHGMPQHTAMAPEPTRAPLPPQGLAGQMTGAATTEAATALAPWLVPRGAPPEVAAAARALACVLLPPHVQRGSAQANEPGGGRAGADTDHVDSGEADSDRHASESPRKGDVGERASEQASAPEEGGDAPTERTALGAARSAACSARARRLAARQRLGSAKRASGCLLEFLGGPLARAARESLACSDRMRSFFAQAKDADVSRCARASSAGASRSRAPIALALARADTSSHPALRAHPFISSTAPFGVGRVLSLYVLRGSASAGRDGAAQGAGRRRPRLTLAGALQSAEDLVGDVDIGGDGGIESTACALVDALPRLSLWGGAAAWVAIVAGGAAVSVPPELRAAAHAAAAAAAAAPPDARKTAAAGGGAAAAAPPAACVLLVVDALRTAAGGHVCVEAFDLRAGEGDEAWLDFIVVDEEQSP